MIDIPNIVQLGGQVVIVFIFLAYLRHKDKIIKEAQSEFIKYIKDHSDNGNLISTRIQKFTDVIEELKNLIKEQTIRIQEQTVIIHKLCERLLKITPKK